MEQVDSTLSVKGNLIIIKTDEQGNQEQYNYDNLVVSVGKTHIADRMASNSTTVMSHMAVGTSSTTAAAGDTDLGGVLANVALTVTGGTPSSNTVTYSATFNPGVGTGSLQEAGVFNAQTLPRTMLCRTTFPVINKQASDTITITWVVSIV